MMGQEQGCNGRCCSCLGAAVGHNDVLMVTCAGVFLSAYLHRICVLHRIMGGIKEGLLRQTPVYWSDSKLLWDFNY